MTSDLGLWTLDFGLWTLDFGPWTLDFGPWTLDLGLWTLDLGLWTLDLGPWTLDLGLQNPLPSLPDESGVPLVASGCAQFAALRQIHVVDPIGPALLCQH